MSDSFFRKEALEFRTTRFSTGNVMLSPPGFAAITILFVALAAGIALLLVFGRYVPKDTVRGYVRATGGSVEVYAPGDATILEIRVTEGQSVQKDQLLMVLSTSRAIGQTPKTRENVAAAQQAERSELEKQLQLEIGKFDEQEISARDEIASLKQQVELLRLQRNGLTDRLALAERHRNRARQLRTKSLLSGHDLDGANANVIEIQLRRRDLDLSLNERRRKIRSNQRLLAEIPLRREARVAEIRALIQRLNARIAESADRNRQNVMSPAHGIVSGLLVHEGQTVRSTNPLLNVVPNPASYFVELLIPTRSIAFVRPGSGVRLRYDAFPYQKFGSFDGVVETIARTTVLPNDKRFRLPVTEPVYVARVRIRDPAPNANESVIRLQSGMTLTADVLRDERRLVEWLFAPVIGAARKL